MVLAKCCIQKSLLFIGFSFMYRKIILLVFAVLLGGCNETQNVSDSSPSPVLKQTQQQPQQQTQQEKKCPELPEYPTLIQVREYARCYYPGNSREDAFGRRRIELERNCDLQYPHSKVETKEQLEVRTKCDVENPKITNKILRKEFPEQY